MLQELELLQVFSEGASQPVRRAVRFAAIWAQSQGATLFAHKAADDFSNRFYAADDQVMISDPVEWASQPIESKHRIIVLADDTANPSLADSPANVSVVRVNSEAWQSEATLFAGSALADLLGDPEREPLVPAGNFAAHSVAYGVCAAITAIHAGQRRFGVQEQAIIDAQSLLTWINWKATAAGFMGKDIHREGKQAEWPVIPCKDGDVAFLFTERDWDLVRNMIKDPRLDDERFATFATRAKNREAYMGPVREWTAKWTKAELNVKFEEAGIPGASVATVTDLFDDPLLVHREAFEQRNGATVPVAPHRIAAEGNGAAVEEVAGSEVPFPLSGIKVLDLGIITAGAGVGALLADLGAEVIKVESETYPDPFRQWAGATEGDSPLFKFNNRNKKGIAIDLKTEEGRTHFLKLAKDADIVIENFRRGVLDRLGMTFKVLSKANPNILLASISGQGLTGPGSKHTTFGSTLEASSGLASLTCYDDKVPVISGRNLNYPDQIVCLYGVAAITAAVTECRLSGVGRHIDISQRDCAVYQAGDVLAEASQGLGSTSVEVHKRLTGEGFDGFVQAADGEYVALSISNPAKLTNVPGLNHGDGFAALANWAATQNADEIVETMLAVGIGAQKNLIGSELLNNPKIKDSRILERSPSGDLVKGFPFVLQASPMAIWRDSPTVGQHTDEYLVA